MNYTGGELNRQCLKRVERCSTSWARRFIPAKRLAADACPADRLFGKPLFYTYTFHRFKLFKNWSVVRASIVSKGCELLAGEITALAAVDELPAFSAGADLALRTTCVDVQLLRPAALAGESFQRAVAAKFGPQQVLAVEKRGAIVVACAAIEATGGKDGRRERLAIRLSCLPF